MMINFVTAEASDLMLFLIKLKRGSGIRNSTTDNELS